jgi:hypothetical protein
MKSGEKKKKTKNKTTNLDDSLGIDEVCPAANRYPRYVTLSGCEVIEGSEQQLNIRETAGAVGVGHQKPPAAPMQHAVADCPALPAISLELHDADVGLWVAFGRELKHGRGGAVRGTVIYDENLECAFWKGSEVLEGG